MTMTTTPVTIADIPNIIRRARERNPRLAAKEILEREIASVEADSAMYGVPDAELSAYIREEMAFTEAADTLHFIFADAGEQGIETCELPEILSAASTSLVPVDVLKDTLLMHIDSYIRIIGDVCYAR